MDHSNDRELDLDKQVSTIVLFIDSSTRGLI